MDTQITVTLSEELVDKMTAAIGDGSGTSLEDVVLEAIDLWLQERDAAVDQIRALVAEAEASGYAPWEGAQAIISRARAEFEAERHRPYRAA